MPLPVEIVPFGWQQTAGRVESLVPSAVLRRVKNSNIPFLTDGGHFIVDCNTGPIADPCAFAGKLKAITGVVDHGLFISLASRALTVDVDGNIAEIRSQPR